MTTRDTEETEKERIDRELIELLNELRVALPGVTVLFGFLLTLPFTNGWARISGTDRSWYFAAVVLTVLSTAFLTAPSAHHRVRFRDRAKEQLLKASSAFAVVGLVLLAGALTASLFLVVDVVYSLRAAAITAGAIGGSIAVLWFVVPLLYRSDPAD